jgi:hypothetical protein
MSLDLVFTSFEYGNHKARRNYTEMRARAKLTLLAE